MREAWTVVEVMAELVKHLNDMADQKELSIETLLGAVSCIHELEKARFVSETMQAAGRLTEQADTMAILEKLLGKREPD